MAILEEHVGVGGREAARRPDALPIQWPEPSQRLDFEARASSVNRIFKHIHQSCSGHSANFAHTHSQVFHAPSSPSSNDLFGGLISKQLPPRSVREHSVKAEAQTRVDRHCHLAVDGTERLDGRGVGSFCLTGFLSATGAGEEVGVADGP